MFSNPEEAALYVLDEMLPMLRGIVAKLAVSDPGVMASLDGYADIIEDVMAFDVLGFQEIELSSI
ncbi:hypothetical protein ACIREO_36120 [Streptomyces sp. NPDC102441]|uniref:hypothetical protein n=1 Tax=Streptomyces sp. NPDC102441 TaxID=3366176 RepID=UPI003826F339